MSCCIIMKELYRKYFSKELFSFWVEDISIKTNVPEIYRELTFFFTPFFNLNKDSTLRKEHITALLISHDEYCAVNSKTKYLEKAEFLYGGKRNSVHLFLESYKCVLDGCKGYYFSKISIYLLEDETGKKIVLAEDANNLYRFMRRFLRNNYLYPKLIQKGYLPLHGACAIKGEKAIAFLGESGAGKTSAMLPLIEFMGYDLVSSDLLFLSKKGEVVGTPEKMRITPITLKQYSPKYDYLISNVEKMVFSPTFFSMVFGCKIVPKAKLDTIILPKIDVTSKINSLNRSKSSSLDLKEYISPAVYNTDSLENSLWNGKVYQLRYNGDVKTLMRLYKKMSCELAI